MTSSISRSGWTLLELLVTLAIFSSLLAALLVSLNTNRQVHLSTDVYLQVQEQARRALDSMVRELRESGHVNNDTSIAPPGVQRLDFQIARSHDPVACGGICWGTEDIALPNGWMHYVVDTTGGRLVRCITAGRLDAMPADYAGCTVLGNSVDTSLANASFTYDHPTRTVTLQLQTAVSSSQVPGGRMQVAPSPLVIRVALRNTL